MRPAGVAIPLVLILALVVPVASAEDFGTVGKVNRLLSVLESPELAPGETGVFRFELNSTYTDPIANVTLSVDIYRYATIDESVAVDGTWSYAFPRIRESGGRTHAWTWPQIAAGTVLPLAFTVETAADASEMPHGSVFSQASYFLRFRLEFDALVGGLTEDFAMASRGHFTEAQWEEAQNATNTDPCTPPWCRGNLNLTVLGVDGILPDSSFGVKEPIPVWPFYSLIAASVAFLVLAFLFWVEENPGSYPRVEAWWARTRGRLVRLRGAARRPKQEGG